MANSNTTTATVGALKQSAGKYALVNGLNIYYEIHGTGSPLVLLHGGFMTVGALGPLLPALAASRQVIAIELEGHGHTADLDRPLSLNQMAEDVAKLVKQLNIKQADFFGFSMGGQVSLRVAMQHPELVRKLVVVSSPYNNDGFYPSIVASWPAISTEGFVGTPMESVYAEAAPQPEHWSVFIGKMKSMMMGSKGWSADEIRSIEAPTLLVVGDADIVRPEHTLEMLRLLGGAGPDAGMKGVPDSQMAMIPGATHFEILDRTDLLVPIALAFLDAPMPEGE